MSQLTEKQIKARAYYQANKEKICAQKRAKSAASSTVSPAKKVKKVVAVNKDFNSTISAKRACAPERIEQPKNVDPQKLRVRRSIEDFFLAKEMGVSLADLGAI
ncbi:hypothetical protein ORI98_06200 [Shewanella sp. ULN5]|uniref:hypothetical protein n=1 Tax=Shewanella sp. ULN5 TaxID=2994678 RepID=UPI00273FEE1A|nr:hypothetical protein [Shewanella sp. ULN5]MDP5146026.1 hypothetical protein [Shewanella sp. ULN5]